jgi:hypothetical protein
MYVLCKTFVPSNNKQFNISGTKNDIEVNRRGGKSDENEYNQRSAL